MHLPKCGGFGENGAIDAVGGRHGEGLFGGFAGSRDLSARSGASAGGRGLDGDRLGWSVAADRESLRGSSPAEPPDARDQRARLFPRRLHRGEGFSAHIRPRALQAFECRFEIPPAKQARSIRLFPHFTDQTGAERII